MDHKETLTQSDTAFSYRLVRDGVFAGLVAALAVVVYRLCMGYAATFTHFFADAVGRNAWWLLAFAALAVVCATVVWLMIRIEPWIAGSGVPQTKAEVLGKIDLTWYRIIPAKIVAGVAACIAGLSLGTEGPSIQLGAMAGKCVAKGMKKEPSDRMLLLICGAGAGLAAAFHAPLTGLIFCIEELQERFSAKVVVYALSACITADLAAKAVFGTAPMFEIHATQVLSLNRYWLVLLFGILLGALGAVHNALMKWLHRLYAKLPGQFLKLLVPFALSIGLLVLLPQVLGSGHSLIEQMTHADPTIWMLCILLIGKILFSLISFCSGAAGGIFLPLLVMGAVAGKLFGQISVLLFGLQPQFVPIFILLGMAGLLSAAVRAPLTSIFLVSEMTGWLGHTLGLSMVSIVACLTARCFKSQPMYHYLFARLPIGSDE